MEQGRGGRHRRVQVPGLVSVHQIHDVDVSRGQIRSINLVSCLLLRLLHLPFASVWLLFVFRCACLSLPLPCNFQSGNSLTDLHIHCAGNFVGITQNGIVTKRSLHHALSMPIPFLSCRLHNSCWSGALQNMELMLWKARVRISCLDRTPSTISTLCSQIHTLTLDGHCQ